MRNTGFSLVELMVGMTVGLVVMGGAIGIYSHVSYSAASLIGNNMMQQEVRNIGLVMTRDIRRAGFSGIVPGEDFNGDGLPNASQTDARAVQDAIRADILFNPHLAGTADVAVYDSVGTNDCILFSYNLDKDLPPENTPAAVESNEWFGYRRQEINGRGVLQMKAAGASPANCTSGTWATITSSEFDVTALSFAMTTTEVEISNLSDGTRSTCEAGDSCICIRTIDVDMNVELDKVSDIGVQFSESIRLPNEKVVAVRSANTHCHD